MRWLLAGVELLCSRDEPFKGATLDIGLGSKGGLPCSGSGQPRGTQAMGFRRQRKRHRSYDLIRFERRIWAR